MVIKYGYTNRCQGCQAISRGKPPQNHSEQCRARIEEKLRKDGDKNLEKAEERIMEQIGGRVRKSDEANQELGERQAKRVRFGPDEIIEPSSNSGSSSSPQQHQQQDDEELPPLMPEDDDMDENSSHQLGGYQE